MFVVRHGHEDFWAKYLLPAILFATISSPNPLPAIIFARSFIAENKGREAPEKGHGRSRERAWKRMRKGMEAPEKGHRRSRERADKRPRRALRLFPPCSHLHHHSFTMANGQWTSTLVSFTHLVSSYICLLPPPNPLP